MQRFSPQQCDHYFADKVAAARLYRAESTPSQAEMAALFEELIGTCEPLPVLLQCKK